MKGRLSKMFARDRQKRRRIQLAIGAACLVHLVMIVVHLLSRF